MSHVDDCPQSFILQVLFLLLLLIYIMYTHLQVVHVL